MHADVIFVDDVIARPLEVPNQPLRQEIKAHPP